MSPEMHIKLRNDRAVVLYATYGHGNRADASPFGVEMARDQFDALSADAQRPWLKAAELTMVND